MPTKMSEFGRFTLVCDLSEMQAGKRSLLPRGAGQMCSAASRALEGRPQSILCHADSADSKSEAAMLTIVVAIVIAWFLIVVAIPAVVSGVVCAVLAIIDRCCKPGGQR